MGEGSIPEVQGESAPDAGDGAAPEPDPIAGLSRLGRELAEGLARVPHAEPRDETTLRVARALALDIVDLLDSLSSR